MISIPISCVNSAIRLFHKDIAEFKLRLKGNLQTLFADKNIRGDRKRYVKQLLRVSDHLITAKPSTLKQYQKDFDNIIPADTMKTGGYKTFRDHLREALGYAARRDDFYPQYFQRIGIKTCVYCNALLAVSVETRPVRGARTVKAKFQVDHYWPKSEYPCFSISLYNLYPVCANCNVSKGRNKVDFVLYDDQRSVSSPFHFALETGSIGKYLITRNADVITYHFHEPKTARGCEPFQKTFDIQGIYDTQKDIAEELILKGEIYSPAYKTILTNNYKRILTKADITNRILLGNYPLEKDIHKRPMAKFTIDLAKQIGLI